MKRKLKKDNNIKKNTLLLITPSIEKRWNKYVLKKIKGKKFIIPAIFICNINSNTIGICLKVNLNIRLKLRKDGIINISFENCRIIDDFGFT